jgi:hypothetical protein
MRLLLSGVRMTRAPVRGYKLQAWPKSWAKLEAVLKSGFTVKILGQLENFGPAL